MHRLARHIDQVLKDCHVGAMHGHSWALNLCRTPHLLLDDMHIVVIVVLALQHGMYCRIDCVRAVVIVAVQSSLSRFSSWASSCQEPIWLPRPALPISANSSRSFCSSFCM